jgi:hypothetical protein
VELARAAEIMRRWRRAFGRVGVIKIFIFVVA